ncbi:Beta-ketoacyl synthase [Cordyceps militaris]|uniref:Beta-ketoacyl synthase n=1 Tax=Cordyceps militaris TaxID=73501 RepID=A0A2H4SNM2_CORMI|nr:Beta-ketoacyl synthase [Cordyceps militaris]
MQSDTNNSPLSWEELRSGAASSDANSSPPEPIAIIGMSCRLSGSAQDPSSLWEMLTSGRTAWTPGPGQRFNMEAFQSSSADTFGMTNTGGGHFLKEDVAAFDAAFFGIHAVEAKAIDPQHRLLLEIAYECFDNSGLNMDSLWGSNTGVYVGQWANDYHEIQTRDIDAPPLYLTTGTGPAISSNRISYFFNLRGPSFTVDTGCSSGFVALHQAVQSLRSGETSQCFVGGVNLMLDPQRFVYQSKLKMFSNEGRSFAFDSRANGYGRGEGCTAVMLKPLSAALRDGDQIRAVIRNSVLNQDGRTAGITVPSPEAQEEAILKAYGDAMLELRADYVEAHGTGTKVGDPKEAGAIAAALARGNSPGAALPIGSIKANIGHTESAAGLAGLIKAVLMLEHGIIPPQANYESPNPDLCLEERGLRVPTQLERRTLRRISVNSFGYGGTNAHVVVDASADALCALSSLGRHTSAQRVFFISGASEKACQRICARLAKYLARKSAWPETDTPELLAKLAYTLSKKSIHPYRLALVAQDINELVQQLISAAYSPVARQDRKGDTRIGLVFSGQGSQYAEMGRELLSSSAVFSRSIDRACQHLTELGSGWNMREELCRPQETTRINEPALSQPLTTAIQLALVDLLFDLKISVSAVVGHSSGEIAAAYAAEAISFEDAMTASYYRGSLTSSLVVGNPECDGAMLAVGADADVVNQRISEVGDAHGRMRIACFNSPSSVTVSGDAKAVNELRKLLVAEGTFNRMLPTNGAAYHSHQMESMNKEYTSSLQKKLSPKKKTSISAARIFSSVTGKENDLQMPLDGVYWAANLLSPVLFSQALREMCEAKYDGKALDMIIEVGPHSQLGGAVKQTVKALKSSSGIAYTSVLKKGKKARQAFLECLGALHVCTATVDLNASNGFSATHAPKLLVDLPPYPFDHERSFWHETRISKDYRHRKHAPHELLGTFAHDTNRVEPRWRQFLSLKQTPWLKSHAVQGQIVFPGAGFLTMAIQAMLQHMHATSPLVKVHSLLLRNVSLSRALVLPADGPDVEITLTLRPESHTAKSSSAVWSEFRIFTVTSESVWTEHCRGLVHAETQAADVDEIAADVKDTLEAGETCVHEVTPQKLYHLGSEIGLDWQHPFNNMSNIRTSRDACVAVARKTVLDSDVGGMGDILHPTVLDSCLFHGLSAVLVLERGSTSTFVPNFIEQLRIFNRTPDSSAELLSTSKLSRDTSTCDVVVQEKGCSPGQAVIFAAKGVHTTTLPGDTGLNEVIDDICHSQDWVTYVDAWTPEHCDRVCRSVITTASSLEDNCLLDALTLQFVQKAVKEVDPERVPDGPRRHFFEWMKIYAETPLDEQTLPPASISADHWAFYEGVKRLGPHLADILVEKTDPLALLTPDNLLGQLYNTERCRRCIVQMAEYCHALGQQSPGLKVLEVGAGTASATLPVIEALNGRGSINAHSYTFTDLSPAFFDPAKERLGSFADAVKFDILDIERCPLEQGFQEAGYDLIIASNVIHATQRIDAVLANIKKLLKPGGKFMLMELTVPTPHYNLLFGVFKGWWAGYDEGRQLSPLIPPSEWVTRLTRAKFSPAELWFQDYPEENGGTISVLIASAPWDVAQVELPAIDVVTTEYSALESGDEAVLRTLSSSEELLNTNISVGCLSDISSKDNIVIILPEVARYLCQSLHGYAWERFKHLVLNARAVLLVGCSSSYCSDFVSGGIWLGFARCLRLELPRLRVITLDLAVERALMMKRLTSVLPTLTRSIKQGLALDGRVEVENEFRESDGQLYVSRLVSNDKMSEYVHRSRQRAQPKLLSFMDPQRPMTAELRVPGLLESIRWKDDVKATAVGPDEVKLELRAASINFKDVLIAAGQLEGINEMRNDCSGVVIEVGSNMCDRFKAGDRVCALYSRSYTNYPVVHGDCCQVVPDSMTYEEAAALPVVWTTVYYSLVDAGRLEQGDKILIHSAAGAVGQAAIMLAKHIGAEVFATVGNSEKQTLLRERYGIADDHIFSSRTPAFHDKIKRLTGGYGVDVVLNSLAGDQFRHSCNLVAPFGRFVEIGRKDLMDDARMSMGFLLKNITFAYVDLSLIMEVKRPLARRLLREVVNLAASGAIRPVTLTTLPITEIETAFRMIQAGKHTGKIVLRVAQDQIVKADPPAPAHAELKPNATYLLVGGFGGLGRAVITWMGSRGAKNILVISRSGCPDKQGQILIKDMEAMGVKVVAEKCDVTAEDEVASLSKLAADRGLPPIRGVIHSAMVLQDSVLEEMTADEWCRALAPKYAGSLNLHRTFGNEVDFFIFMSSAVALRGNVGQSNYAAACSFQDALARYRTAAGLPAFSINVGPVREVGFVSENPQVAAALRKQGLGTISMADLLTLLNYAVVHRNPEESVCSIGMLPRDTDESLTDRRFAHLVRHDVVSQTADAGGVQFADIPRLLDGAAPGAQLLENISQLVLMQLSKLIASPVETLSAAQSLDSYGVDSLVAVELRNWVGAYLQANVPLMVLRGTSSIHELAKIIAKESRFVTASA